MRFTQEQRDAIFARGESLLVSAAAGSGKTAVLVERIVELLREGTPPEGLMVVTYTRAAAAEMKERVIARLRAEGGALAELAPRMGSAYIQTLHAFCSRLLKRFFVEADLPPSFVTDGGAGLYPLSRRAMDEALDAALSSPQGPSLGRLCLVSQLEALVTRTCDFLLNQPLPSLWAQAALERYAAMVADFDASPIAEALAARRTQVIGGCISRMERALALSHAQDGPWQYIEFFTQDIDGLRALLDAQETFAWSNLTRAKKPKDIDPEMRIAAKALRDDAKKRLAQADKLRRPSPRDIRRMGEMLPPLSALFALCQDYMARYEALRTETGRLTYGDLEHKTLAALSSERVRNALGAQFAYILVDEYQDANAVQEAIITAIAREDNRFMVGDVKQSIYRFRMADPTIFLRAQKAYGQGVGGRRIDLNQNFRSVPAVLAAVNHLFAHIMHEDTMEIQYDERAALYAGREGECGPPVDIVVLHDESEETGEDAQAEPDEADAMEPSETQPEEGEAAEVARIIQELLGSPIPDGKGGQRPSRPSDVAILLRAVQGRATAYQAALERRGIPCEIDAGGALLTMPEVKVFLDLLRAVDNRHRDLPLMGAMRHFGDFSLDELALVRTAQPREGHFYDAAFLCAQETSAVGRKAATFLERLLLWRERARALSLPDFLGSLMEETEHEQLSALRSRGKHRLANLRALCALASRSPGATLGEFLSLVDAKERVSGSADTAVLPAQDSDAVRILSVHKSKGLEFPVVIGADLGRRFNRRDTTSSLLLHAQLGVACDWINAAVTAKAPCAAREGISAAARQEMQAEEARLLYVLMTRARERLILVGKVPNLQTRAHSWASMEGAQEAGCLLDMLAPALLTHPDAHALRALLPAPPETLPSAARFCVRIVATRDIEQTPTAHRTSIGNVLDELRAQSGQDVSAAMWDKLRWTPPQEQGEALQKTSVTALVKGEALRQTPSEVPLFLQGEQKEPAAQRGLALHAVLRALVLPPLRGKQAHALTQQIQEQIDHMAQRKLLTAAQAAAICPQDIARFFEGEFGRDALNASELLREQPFNLRLQEKGDVRLVQGIVDLCYAKDGGPWTLIDYKTDRIGLSASEVAQRHGQQLRHYAQALHALTGRPVQRALVYLFATGAAVPIDIG